jgi:hypothetical protein
MLLHLIMMMHLEFVADHKHTKAHTTNTFVTLPEDLPEAFEAKLFPFAALKYDKTKMPNLFTMVDDSQKNAGI